MNPVGSAFRSQELGEAPRLGMMIGSERQKATMSISNAVGYKNKNFRPHLGSFSFAKISTRRRQGLTFFAQDGGRLLW